MNHVVTLLAQAGQTPPANPASGQPGASMFLPLALLAAMLVFMFMMQRGQQKKAEERKRNLLDSLAKNDRVLTIGGIIGTVSAVREHEVVLKVDETTNAKMVFLKKAIQQKITDDAPPQLDDR